MGEQDVADGAASDDLLQRGQAHERALDVVEDGAPARSSAAIRPTTSSGSLLATSRGRPPVGVEVRPVLGAGSDLGGVAGVPVDKVEREAHRGGEEGQAGEDGEAGAPGPRATPADRSGEEREREGEVEPAGGAAE